MGLARVRSPQESRDVTRFENRREREFYRYYEPIRSLTKSGPPLCDLHDGTAVESHVAISSPDRALTAFCQLGALRMGTRRAMLFFFDSKFAYVLAEATRTLSLQDDSVHEIEDALWLGHSVIPRGFSVCEETVCRAPSGVDQMHPLFRAANVHVITDLEADTTFCDRPFVLDGPKARFYAGVPITTPKGINIGAYCCLDDKTRPEGIGPKDIQFLHDMAATVMTHLETVRAKSEFERGTQMVTGLSAYVEGASSARKGQTRIPRRVANKTPAPTGHVDVAQPNSHQRPTENGTTDTREPPNWSLQERTLQPDHPGSASGKVDDTDAIPNQSVPASNNELTLPIRSIRQPKDLREQLVTPTVRHSFERAAQLVREAVDVHGVMFLDTTVGTFGGLVHSDTSFSGNGSDGASAGSESMFSENETSAEPTTGTATASSKACHVLAQSFEQPAAFNDSKHHQVQIMTDKFLHSLLRKFPRGKVWNFSQVGEASSDEESVDANTLDNSDDEWNVGTLPDFGRGAPVSRISKRARKSDSREIRRLFPGVRSLAVIGLWNQNRGNWYAACVVWTYSPLRIFSPESELNFVSAWCDVIMAEVDRLEALDADRTKGDFISSISHELRSPLHGILGSVECLQEHLTDPLSITLASQVEICGRTLLDVIDHVLEYSRVGAKSSKGTLSYRREQDPPSEKSRSPRIENMGAVEADVVLDEITEDVIQSAVYSFGYKSSSSGILDRKVAVVLDIEQSPDISWNCHVPLGAWKRICINLVGNALKYTDRGVIQISLKAHPIPGSKRWFHAAFTVRDTGRGMSKVFLQNHLFKAFTQEDTLVEGTGLGMNLVAKIVKSLDGRIDVVSEKGVGTTVSLKIPIEIHRSRIRDNGSIVNSDKALGVVAGGLLSDVVVKDPLQPTVLLVSRPTPQDEKDLTVEARQLLLKSIERICCSFTRSIVQSSDTLTPREHDVSILLDSDLAWYITGNAEPREGEDTEIVITAEALAQPVVVVCDSAVSERDVRARMRLLNFVHVDCIVQPCTRKNVASAVYNCFSHKLLKQQTSGQSSTSNEIITLAETKTSLLSASLTEHKAKVPIVEADSVSTTTINGNEPRLRNPKMDNSQPVKIDVEQNPQPAEGYFVGRSLSTGNSPASPHALTPLPHIDRTKEQQSATKGTKETASSAIVNHSNPDARHRPPLKPPTPSKSSLSLLLVDDNSINLQLLVTYATKQGYPRVTANDGAQAVEAYKSAWSKCLGGGVEPSTLRPPPPDIILMDINMPVMDGFEATRQIRAFEQQNNLSPAHVIALTGLSSPIAQQEAFSSGVNLFLTKPVRLKELTKLLRNIHAADSDMNTEKGS